MNKSGMPTFTLLEIAGRLGGRLVGENRVVSGVRPLDDAGPGDLSFLTHARYLPQLSGCRAGGILVPPDLEASPGPSLVVVDRPYVALARVMAIFYQRPRPGPGVDPRAAVAANCRLSLDVSVGPFV